MSNFAAVGIIVMGIGALMCFANSGGLVKFLKLRNLKRHGVQGEAVSTLQEWISGGHRVYYLVLLPGAPSGSRQPHFIEVGVEPRGPVGTVVPVVYDRRNPDRARTGTLADIADIDLSDDWRFVKLFWVPGLTLVALGALLAITMTVI
ncbi:DUF3592 domain-containing protein [Streptomyces sp. MBT62]|uniref:DUF3592 domain-containing protein n=1 Tax=Streptomyces sp. MBT62 TaxID=2800410 RepID=UPI00190CCB24|nr:DUF3592 domain-containing protein [Streptomyces sp. MBT62]MBK3566466.1 hypothetical protein [Streptomyces sp. MBT62]